LLFLLELLTFLLLSFFFFLRLGGQFVCYLSVVAVLCYLNTCNLYLCFAFHTELSKSVAHPGQAQKRSQFTVGKDSGRRE